MTVLAHAGHWLVSVAYAAPVIGLLGWMAALKVRDVRAQRRARPDGD